MNPSSLPVPIDIRHSRMESVDIVLCALACGCGILGCWLYYGLITTFVY